MKFDSATSQEAEEPPSLVSAQLTFPTTVILPAPAVPATNVISISAAKAPRAVRAIAFPVNPLARSFYKQHFRGSTAVEWNDWRWQLRERIRSLADLERMFALSAGEREAVRQHTGSLPVGITPYYASLMSYHDPLEALRRTHIPVGDEYLRTPGEADDPLGEDHDTHVPGLVHRYPDRVLFLATGFCSTYCRYCTRSRMVGEAGGDYRFDKKQWERALEYIAAHPEIRDVLLSGGDPLTLADDKLDYLLGRLRAIKHVEFVRIGTKVPVVVPQRITRQLVRTLRKHHPLWMSIHFTPSAGTDAGSHRSDGEAGRRWHSAWQPDRPPERNQ